MHEKMKRNASSFVSRIRNWMLDGTGTVELGEKEEACYERLRKAWSLRGNGYTSAQAASVLVKEYDVSRRQAENDVRDALTLYGDVSRADKEGHRMAAAELCQKLIRRALDNDDLKALDAAIGRLIKIHGLDRDDPEMPDVTKMKRHLINVVIDERSENVLHQLATTAGPLNLSKMMNELAEDIEGVPVEVTGG